MIDIFVHIPKTGGTTLNTTLRWVYGPCACYRNSPEKADPELFFRRIGEKRLQKIRSASGHVHLGVHRYIDRNCRYFTILRHPVRRYVSRYFHLKLTFPNSSGASMGLEEFCRSDHGWSMRNQLVRYVSGKSPEENPQAALDKAKENLMSEFDAFGLLERFDESLLLFWSRLDWSRPPFYVSTTRNPDRPTIEDLPEETTDIVRAHHQLDLELYRFAQQQFEKTLQEEFENLSGTLQAFRRRNSIAQSIAPLLLYFYRRSRDLIRGH